LDLTPYVGFIAEWMGVIAVAWLMALSKRLQKPLVGFRYARRDGLVALGLYAAILLFSVIYVTARPPVFPTPQRIAPAPVVDFGYWLVLAAVCLLPFIAALLIRSQPARSIGWDPELLRTGLMIGVAMAFLTIFLRNRMMDVLGGVNKQSAIALLLALGIALAEETIFRGYIQLRLGWWLGQWPGMLLSAALFALWHVPAWLHLPLQTILTLAGLTFVQGLVLGWIMIRCRHVAAPALYRAISIWVSWIG
jgi:membrane protease YdiL (CAAX protease family)